MDEFRHRVTMRSFTPTRTAWFLYCLVAITSGSPKVAVSNGGSGETTAATATAPHHPITMRAVLSMQGIKGSVLFEDRPDGVRMQFKFPTLVNRTLKWEIREFPTLYDDSDRCGTSRIGRRLNISGSTGQVSFSVVTPEPTQIVTAFLLIKESGSADSALAGRSILLSDDVAKIRACATIQPFTEVSTAQAIFTGCDYGRIYFREISPKYIAIVSTMTFLCAGSSVTSRRLLIVDHQSSGRNDESGCDDVASLGESSQRLLHEIQAGTTYFVLVGTTLRDIVNSRLVALVAPRASTITFSPRCAHVTFVRKRSARVLLSSQGVAGYVAFEQNSPFEPTLVSYSLRGLRRLGGSFHVHQFPVPEKMAADDQLCSADAVAGHWNPFGVDASRSPPSGTGTEDQYEVGDLSGKYGSLVGKESVDAIKITDWNLPLFGPNRIIGRSLVIHNSSNAAQRWVCADIGFPETSVTAVAYFQYPLIGQVVMTQSPDEAFGETTLFAQLGYSGGEMSYDTRRLAITSGKVAHDFASDVPRRCQSAGHVWNPTKATNAAECSRKNIYGCAVGELSTRGCEIRISPATSSWQKIFCTDAFLPLSGPFSIIGKSMTVYGADNRTALACADVVREMPLVVSTSRWAGPLHLRGNLTMRDTETAATILSLRLEGLDARASSYAIHERPVHVSSEAKALATDFDCLSSVGGLYNPIQLQPPLLTTAEKSTDQFVTGDLSGKHGSLEGLSSVDKEVMDNNLPLSGTNSVVGRSIVVKDSSGRALACSNLRYMARDMGARTIKAMASFSDVPGSEIGGYVIMTQAVHPDGAETSTTVEVLLRYNDGAKQPSEQPHTWRIHTSPLEEDASGSACLSSGPCYNPFNRDSNSALYGALCNPYSSAMCELGDMSSKFGVYSMNGSGGEPQVHTDVYLPLSGNFSVVGRSVVVSRKVGSSSATQYVACANILPVGQPTVLLTFAETSFSKSELIKIISNLLETGAHNIAVQRVGAITNHHGGAKQSCTQVRVHFNGADAEQLSQRLQRDVLLLGRFAPGLCSKATVGGLSAATLDRPAWPILVVASLLAITAAAAATAGQGGRG